MLSAQNMRRLPGRDRIAAKRSTIIGGSDMSRRNALTQLAALPLMMAAGSSAMAETKSPLKIMMKSAWGSDDPTKAAFPFLHGSALAEAGHTVQIFLLGEAVSLDFCVWRVLPRPWSD